MTADSRPFDIGNIPELARLAEDVEATKKPRTLMRDKKTVAILIPVSEGKTKKKRVKTTVDYEAFRAAFGSWSDVDTETLLKNIYADRHRTNARLPVKL